MKIQRWIVAVTVTILGLGVGLGWSHFHNVKPSAYQTVPLKKGNIDATVAATGNSNAVVNVQVGSQVSGNIKALYADFNTKVKKDQLVAVIDPEMFQAKVNQAKANVDSARSAVLNAQAAAQKAETDIASAIAVQESAKAQVLKAQADMGNANVELKRKLQGCEKGITTKEDCDAAQATYDADAALVQAAQAQVNATEQNVKSAQAEHELMLAQVESASAQVRQFQAALAQAALDLSHTQIRAPVDGTVIARHMDVGQTVAASFSAPTIFEIAQDLTKMQVDTNVDESDVGGVRLGQKATFTVDAYPGFSFPAVVSQIRQAPINVQNVITYDVVLTVDNRELKLFPGMTANVRISTNSVKDTLRVPNAAFRFRLPGAPAPAPGKKQAATATIYVLSPDGSARPVQVTTGLTDGNFTAVSSGPVQEGDLVIVGSTASASSTSGTGGRGPTF